MEALPVLSPRTGMPWPSPLLVLSLVVAAYGDGYGHGMGKSTYAASDPLKCYAFFDTFLPVRCQDPPSFGFCNSTGECYTSGRASLCNAADILPGGGACTYPNSSMGARAGVRPGLPKKRAAPAQDFGLHAVNVSSRPGYASILQAEAIFDARWARAVGAGELNAVLDYATMLFAPSLDGYLDAFDAAGVDHLLVGPWADDENNAHASVLVRACGMIILELVSSKIPAPRKSTVVIADGLSRLPAAVFRKLHTSTQDPRVLQPLGVSKAASDLDAVDAFYAGPMRGEKCHGAAAGGADVVVYALPGAGAVVRFLRRGADAAVRELETLKKDARAAYHVDAFCGVDKWYDNHYDYVQYDVALDDFREAFVAFGAAHHVFGNGTVPYNVYVGDPTGDSIQLVGAWREPPALARGDALTDACTQGNCGRFTATAACAAALRADEALRGAKTNCTDALYGARWADLVAATCTNADVVNFCVPDSC